MSAQQEQDEIFLDLLARAASIYQPSPAPGFLKFIRRKQQHIHHHTKNNYSDSFHLPPLSIRFILVDFFARIHHCLCSLLHLDPTSMEENKNSSSNNNSSSSFDWIEIFQETKRIQQECDDHGTTFIESVHSTFLPWKDQLLMYGKEISRSKADSTLPSHEMKCLVLQTRAALRFGLCCLSMEHEKEENINSSSNKDELTKFQSTVTIQYHWYKPLVTVLSYQRGDSKCRVFAARLLSNLVTCNVETAREVSSNLPLCPTSEFISSSILNSISSDEEKNDDPDTAYNVIEPNWVDMILSSAKSKNREALAAIAAALHNCIVSLEDYKSNNQFAESVSSNGMLISTLLRHFVSAEVLTTSLAQDSNNKASDNNQWDSATEWIQLLFSKLAKIGMLSKIYSFIAGNEQHIESNSHKILPEQNVLLHCLAREADSYVMDYRTDDNTVKNPFGGEAGLAAIKESYSFLAQILSNFSPILQNDTTNPHDDAIETSLIRSGLILVTDILASTLGVDSPENKDLRLFLGNDTSLLQDTAKCLGIVTDDLAEKSVGRRARDIHLSDDDQKLLTSLVQLIGNLCYLCSYNQDLLRTTLVPQTIKAASNSNDCGGALEAPRNGLHVLLTCTTYATSCFTLREWGVIAIRNALEDNIGNQTIVAELVAQDPVQTADLEHAGINVKLDSKGKVTLSKIEEENPKIEQVDNDDKK
jgi:hypothetical protein